MANPPTTIGPFNNVPAPGSPIRSDWAQSCSTYITNNVLRKDIATAQTVTGATTFSAALTAASVTASTGNVSSSNGNIIATNGNVYAGTTPTDTAVGIMLRNDGVVFTTVNDPTPLSTPSMIVQRTGVAAGVGGPYMSFRRLAGGAQIGSITIIAGPGVAYNVTSDRRLKNIVGPVADAVTRVGELQPRRLEWRLEPDAGQFDGFIADEVQDVVPNAVTGEPDAVLPATDEWNPGGIDPQQFDASKLIPLLVAAVQELTVRLTALETP